MLACTQSQVTLSSLLDTQTLGAPQGWSRTEYRTSHLTFILWNWLKPPWPKP